MNVQSLRPSLSASGPLNTEEIIWVTSEIDVT
jgi:hypothetical protein